MFWVGADPLDAYVGSRCAGLWSLRGLQHWELTENVEQSIQALTVAMSDRGARGKLRIWLSGALCRPFILAHGDGLRRSREWDLAAHAVAAEVMATSSPLRLWCEAPGRGREKCFGTACLESIAANLEDELVGQVRGRLSIRPWWARLLQHSEVVRPEASWLAVVEDDALTLLEGSARGISGADVVGPVGDLSAAQLALKRRVALMAEGVEGMATAHMVMPEPVRLCEGSGVDNSRRSPFEDLAVWSR